MKKLSFVLVLLLLLLAGSTGFARDWFVATTGHDDTGDGSQGNPYATLQNTFNHAQAGTPSRCAPAPTPP